jgi:hypothetical protein
MERRTRKGTRTVSRDQEIPECAQQASNVASLAFARVRTHGNGALAWLGGFRAGVHGAPYVRPLGALDPEKSALGFIEGRGHRGHP